MNFTHLRVGLMLLASLGLAVALVLFLSRNRVSDGLSFETYFSETVQGMDVGSPVRFRGVRLGQVTEMLLASAAYPESAGSVQERHNRLVVVRMGLLGCVVQLAYCSLATRPVRKSFSPGVKLRSVMHSGTGQTSVHKLQPTHSSSRTSKWRLPSFSDVMAWWLVSSQAM